MIGIPWIGGGSDAGKKIELKSGYALPHDEGVGAVIVGFDREINYHKIQYAQLCINENEGCEFIATNLDAVTHLTDAQARAALPKSGHRPSIIHAHHVVRPPHRRPFASPRELRSGRATARWPAQSRGAPAASRPSLASRAR